MIVEDGIIIGLEERGEHFWLLDFLACNLGMIHPLLRKSRRSTRPDLFDAARLTLRQKTPGQTYFVEKFEVLQRRSAIGRDYTRLKIASQYCQFLRKNSYHLENFSALLDRSELFFNAMEKGIAPHAALFKTIYLFVKEEGQPVKEDWWARLPPNERETVRLVLTTSLDEQKTSDEEVAALVESLTQWLKGYAHFL